MSRTQLDNCIDVVVDTNTLVDAIFHEDTECQDLFQYKHDGEIRFCMNIRTFQEAFRIFARTLEEIDKKAKKKKVKITKLEYNNLFYKLSNALWEIRKIDGKTRTNYCLEDPEDNKFIDCCIDGNIKYLVTSDEHLLKLKEHEEIRKKGIEIMDPHSFSIELLRLKFQNNYRK